MKQAKKRDSWGSRLGTLFLAALLLLNTCGCAPLVIGAAAGALGAYAISKDTIQGDMDKSYDQLWGSALMVARSRGLIKEEDKIRGYLEFQDGTTKVTVRLVQLTRSTIRLKVTARKHHFPNLNLAQDIYVKISEGTQ